MSRTPFDELDEIVNPLRYAQRMADEYTGVNYARTLARDLGIYSARDALAHCDYGLNARDFAELDATVTYAREVAAARHFETAREQAQALGLLENAVVESAIEQMRLATSAVPGPDSLTERAFAETQAIALAHGAGSSALAMETAAEQVRCQYEESGLLSSAEQLARAHTIGLANLHELNRASAVDEAMRDAMAHISEWMQTPSLTSLMHDAVSLSSPLGLSADEWSQLTDPCLRMQTLASQLEPLGQLIDRYALVDPLEDAVARLQRDWDHARHGFAGVDFDTLERLASMNWVDGSIDDDDALDDDTSAEVDADVETPAESAPTTAPPIVPEYFVAVRFFSGHALVRRRTARLAARFDARVATRPDALSDWLLIICGHRPAYADRISTLSCRVLHGTWLCEAYLKGIAGTTAVGSDEHLTVGDAQEFDEAVVALVAVLDEIETSLDAG